MPVRTKTTRKVVIAAGILAAIMLIGVVAWFSYWHIVDSRNPYGGHNPYGMRDYTPAVQEPAATKLVAGLNTRNPDNVDLLRFHGQPESDATNRTIAENITSALPAPGCRYDLAGVEDKGEQDHPADLVPWYGNVAEHAWAFDMKLQQLCPDQPPTPRTIRVIAIPSGMGGYWAEAAVYPQP